MFALNQPNPFRENFLGAELVLRTESLYLRTKQVIGKFFTVCFGFFIAFPVMYFFRLYLNRRRKAIIKARRNKSVFNNSGEYRTFKENLEHLNKLMPDLTRVSQYNLNKAPWFLKPALKELLKLNRSIVLFDQWANNQLDDYNKSMLVSVPDTFEFKSEKDLWATRNPVYDYWM